MKNKQKQQKREHKILNFIIEAFLWAISLPVLSDRVL